MNKTYIILISLVYFSAFFYLMLTGNLDAYKPYKIIDPNVDEKNFTFKGTEFHTVTVTSIETQDTLSINLLMDEYYVAIHTGETPNNNISGYRIFMVIMTLFFLGFIILIYSPIEL